MKFFVHAEQDAMFATNRCHFEADHGRAGLAVDRLRDLAEEIPDNSHVFYAEGILRRDYLGQGVAARTAFQNAYQYAVGNSSKRETARLAAYNAALLAPDEPEFRRWARLAIDACGSDCPEDREFLSELLAELDRGVTYIRLLLHSVEELERENPGNVAAVLEVALLTGNLSEDLILATHKNRAIKLRELDRKVQQFRENAGETFPPDERVTLHEAMRELESALELDQDDATLWNFKSAWVGLLGQYNESIVAADRAVELRPYCYARPHINKAYALYRLGKCEEAVAGAREGLRHAEEENAPEQIAQARILIQTYAQPEGVPTLDDLCPALLRVAQGAGFASQEELAQVRKGGITIEMVAKRLVYHANSTTSQPSKAYVPIVAQLLGDFTPETALAAALRAGQKSRKTGDYLFWATLYLAAHSRGVQCRDAARLLVLMLLVFANDAQTMRQFYRWNVLEPSAAANDEMSGLDAIVRDQLGRINGWLPHLIADQEPVDEQGKIRATRNILFHFVGDPPPPIRTRPLGCLNVAAFLISLLLVLVRMIKKY